MQNQGEFTMKVILTITEEQAQIIVNSLDLYQRLLMGQFNELESLFVHHGKTEFWHHDKFREILKANLEITRIIIYPDLTAGAYYSILDFGHTPKVARIAYDIQAAMNHDISWKLHPDGGITTNFDRPYHAEKDVPLPGIRFTEEE